MSIDLQFEPAPGLAAVLGPGRLRLYLVEDQYHLPRVMIRSVDGEPVEVWDVFLVDLNPSTGAFGEYVRRSYPTSPWRAARVGSPQEVSAAVPVFEQLRIPGTGRFLSTVTMAWRVTAGADRVTTADFLVTLEFAERGEQAGGVEAVEATGSQVVTEPLRRPAIGPNTAQSTKMFAIDFGTSSSTVTVVDDRRLRDTDLDRDQDAVLCRRLAVLLRSAGPTDEAAAASWRQLLERCLRDVLDRTRDLAGFRDRPPRTVDELADRLDDHEQSVADDRARLRDLVMINLRPGATGPVPGRWLAGELHRLLDDVFFTPALHTFKVRKVPLGPAGRSDAVASVVHVVQPTAGGSPLVNLIKPAIGEEYTLKASLPGLKRDLARSRPMPAEIAALGWRPAPRQPAGTDFLVLHAYNWLIDAALKDERRTAPEPPEANHVIVTYPTTLPPAHRERLKDLFRTDLGVLKPDLTYDEGVAAAMYFLMRELRGSLREGVERFRSRSRAANVGGRRLWRRTVLVIDIGGGTTDIALLALDLENRTPAQATDPKAGRAYLLTPRVLGSTGHPQLGGDLITLRIFYWIKALLADELVAAMPAAEREALDGQWPGASRAPDGSYRPLAPIVLGNQTLDPVPCSAREALRHLLPTHRGSGVLEFAFERLWHEAENAKIALGRLAEPGSVTVLDSQLDSILAEIRAVRAPLSVAQVKAPSLELSTEDFTRIVRPVIAKAAELAAEIVDTRLRGPAGEPIDQVFFSGRSAQMPLVCRLVTETLARSLSRSNADGRPGISWDPGSLVVESTNAKQAASLGACWAEEQRNLHANTADGAGLIAMLNNGGSTILINVDNMFISLPCHFFLREPDGGYGLRLLSAGDPCRYSDRRGNLAARSRWYPVPRNLRVHRDLGDHESIEWGEFQYHVVTHALRRAGSVLPDEPPPDLHFQLQVDQDLIPTVFLCLGGQPHYLVHEPGIDINNRLPAGFVRPVRPGGGLTVSIQAVGNPAADPDGAGRSAVFPAGGGEAAFRYRMENLHPDVPAVLGMISEYPLPAAAETREHGHEWRFEAVDAVGNVVPLVDVPPPDGRYDRKVRYFASLDTAGLLRVHRGYPRYLTTTRFVDMLSHPGTVFHTGMSPGVPMFNEDWDPFTGGH